MLNPLYRDVLARYGVAAMFAEEKPSLLPLPIELFRYHQYGRLTVHLDGCVEVESACYGSHNHCSKRTAQLAISNACREGGIVQDNGHYRLPE
jgi:hypothetical protein